MTGKDATIVKEMIEGIEDSIGTARRQSYSFVAQLLEMARLELLMTYHGIKEGELETFCEALIEEPGAAHDRRSIVIGDASPRRSRRGRSNPRQSCRSAGPATS
jgi:hypothetical protein